VVYGSIGAERLLAWGRDASVDGEVSEAGGELERQRPDEPGSFDAGLRPKSLEHATRPLHRLVRSQTRDRHHDGQDRRRSPAEAGIDGQHLLPASQEQPGSHEQHE